MQKQGTLQLPSKVAFAIGKNISHVNSLGKDYEAYKHKLLITHVEQDNNGKFGTIQVNGQNEYQFKTDPDRDIFLKAIQDYMDEEINFIEHKISIEDLKQVHNIPVDTLAVFEEFGITTEISLATMKMIN